jgi:2-dehydropantoate 2-reductase
MSNYTIVGAGAIGGTIGAYMARQGINVTFVDMVQDHVDAINQNGLTIRGYEEEFNVPARACTPDNMPQEMGAVILAVKAPATPAAMAQIAPNLTADGFVVSAQNGLNELTISKVIGAQKTIGCFVNFSADYLEPGLIHFGGPGAFYIGELDGAISPRLTSLRSDMAAWGGGPVATTDNIWGYLWGKQAYGAILFATALTNETMADAISDYRSLMVALGREVLAVAAAEKISPLGFDGFEPEIIRSGSGAELDASIDRMVAVRRRDQKTHTGVWRDLAVRKRKTEVSGRPLPPDSGSGRRAWHSDAPIDPHGGDDPRDRRRRPAVGTRESG